MAQQYIWCMDKKDKTFNDFSALFSKEFSKVKNGGSANELSSLIKDYQYSVNRDAPLSKECLAVYYASLLISHKFHELRLAVDRYSEIYTGPSVANEARKSNFAALLKKTAQLQDATKSQLAKHFPRAIRSYILKELAKDYLNIEISFLQNNYGITNEDLESNNCQIDGKFVILPASATTERLDQLLDDRIRQLVGITQHVIKS